MSSTGTEAALGTARTGSSPRAAPWRFPPGLAFPMLATVLFAFFFSAAAPTPLFVVFQHAWGFSSSMLTVAFAVYALALLVSLLVAGALSDHIGRRPVVLASLLLQIVTMGLFLTADGIGGLIAARVVQGISMGIASGALTAAVVESAPASSKRLGALITSVSPMAGLAAGGLFTGVIVKIAADPVTVVFGVMCALFVAGAAVVLWMPETVTRRPGAWGSLVPRMSVPPQARAQFRRAVPVFAVTWALGGLFLALAPSVVLHVFEVDDGVVNGLTVAVLSGFGAVAPSLFGRLGPSRAVLISMLSLVAGLALLLVSLATQSLVLFFVASAIAGLGFGGGFSAMVQTLAPLASAHERGELFAAIFVVSYFAFSVPTMGVGLLVAPLGLLHTVEAYAALLLVIAALGAWSQWAVVRKATTA